MANKLTEFFLKVGRFFRIIDEQYPCLSITNIACLVIVVKIALAAEPSIADLSGLLITLLAYYGKKNLHKGEDKTSEEQKKAMAELTNKVREVGDRIGGVAAMVGIKNLK